MKELIKNMQEMVLMGAGIHTKVFKSGPTQMKIVMDGSRKPEIDALMDFFYSNQAKYVKSISLDE